MRKLIGTLLLGMWCVCATAADPAAYNVLTIDRTDGVRETVQFSPAMVLKFLPETIRIEHPQVTVEYAVSEVSAFTYATVEDPKIYDGDHEVLTSIDEVSAPGHDIKISTDGISATGTDDLVVYNLSGIEIARAQSDGNGATLNITSLPAGVYIVKLGNTTLKLRL